MMLSVSLLELNSIENLRFRIQSLISSFHICCEGRKGLAGWLSPFQQSRGGHQWAQQEKGEGYLCFRVQPVSGGGSDSDWFQLVS
ncbi:hypothetical protein Csa_001760 [Cucumis sativus]|uniref:Uncharacterized protein n=1 Tax=Cucumis sativus TaxID=3659 RepID=A0A0A0LB82_CUCSA|nr:hypothetical protein Csa_001760 [Cucumis sativus]